MSRHIMLSFNGSDVGEDGYLLPLDRQVLIVLLIIASIFGTVGNSYVVMAVASSKRLRTTNNVFVVNLACSDVLACLVLPWQAVALLGGQEWPLPGAAWLCTAAVFVLVLTIGCRVNNLALIAVNRWVGITKSRYTTRRIYTARKLAVMVAVSWAVPLCCALTPVLTNFSEFGFEELYSMCTWYRSNVYSNYYEILIVSIFYIIQLIVIVFCYSSIFVYVRRTSSTVMRINSSSSVQGDASDAVAKAMRRKLLKRQLDVTKNMLYIILSFLVCFTPYVVALLVSPERSRRLMPWGSSLMYSNGCINPVIYAASHPDFKGNFRRLFRRRHGRCHACLGRLCGCRAVDQDESSAMRTSQISQISGKLR